jgi:ribosomal protein L37AE/L43A
MKDKKKCPECGGKLIKIKDIWICCSCKREEPSAKDSSQN